MRYVDLADFRTWGSDTRGWRVGTRDAYSHKVMRADVWLQANRNVAVARASTESLYWWLSSLSPAPATRNGHRNALVAYYCYLAERRRRRDNPAEDLPRLREPRRVPKALSHEDVKLLLKVAAARGRKWEVTLLLLSHTGMRASEACSLEWADVHDGWIVVDGKGGHQRSVPKSERLRDELTMWRSESPDAQWVLPGRWPGQHLTYQGLYYTVAQIGEAAGVAVHPHLLRSTFATALLGEGVDVKTVSGLLGHVNIATTSRYLAARDGAARDAVGRLPWGA